MDGSLSEDCSKAWLDAIEASMVCVNTALVPQDQESADGADENRQNSRSHAIQASLDYLTLLETILEQEYEHWHEVPTMNPPDFKPGRNSNKSRGSRGGRRNNVPVSLSSGFEDVDEGGDLVMMRNPTSYAPSTPGLVMRRLVIRIMTAQSELYAQRASQCRSERPFPQWKLGAETYQKSLDRILEAIQLADSEISRLFSLGQEATELAEDANVVHIASSFFASERESYLRAAKAQEQRLLNKLQPQWSSRDEVRTRIGDDRWTNNPRPKRDHSKKRLQDERQLKDVRAAVKDLVEMNNVEALAQDVQHLQNRSRQQPKDELQRRYNGMRPANLSKRVSLDDYPDPTNFGWTFTGSWQYAEFFEREEIKLDWYYTTATIKTSLDHPTQGRTQLFASRVTPEIYRSVLLNARQHTGERYHTRRGKKALRKKQG